MLQIKFKLLIRVIIFLKIWLTVNSLPNGAPEAVCNTMVPFHGGGIPAQQSPPPFLIRPSSTIVGAGQTVRVEILPTPQELQFGGFMIQARNKYPPYEIVGEFSDHINNNVKFMNCSGGLKNSITHSDANKKGYIDFEWQAPFNFLGEIIFNSTVAQDYNKFWVGIQSETVKIVKRELAPQQSFDFTTNRSPTTSNIPVYRQNVKPLPKQVDQMYNNCGVTKTCFGFPDNCLNDQSCSVIAAVTVKGDTYGFEMKSGAHLEEKPAYVAIGLSEDKTMGDDLVIECVQEGGRILAYSSLTTPRPNLGVTREGVPQNSVRLISGNYINGSIYCNVEKSPVVQVQGKTFDLRNNKYYILIASGKKVDARGVGYHDVGRLPSASAINLAVVQEIKGASMLLVKLHGAFMIIAWIGTTSIGIVLARYFKQTWVGSQLCGKDQWFAWHRICMVTTWSLTITAFVLIFVELGAWSERNPHAVLGVITTAICFFQPIGALFRPHPNSKNRPYFNWTHWFGGNLAHILAIVTIFFSIKLKKADLPEWMDMVLVAFVIFHCIMHIIFSIINSFCGRKRQTVDSFSMTDMISGRNNMKPPRAKEEPSMGGARRTFFVIYVVGIIIFVCVFLLLIIFAPFTEKFESLKSKIMNN